MMISSSNLSEGGERGGSYFCRDWCRFRLEYIELTRDGWYYIVLSAADAFPSIHFLRTSRSVESCWGWWSEGASEGSIIWASINFFFLFLFRPFLHYISLMTRSSPSLSASEYDSMRWMLPPLNARYTAAAAGRWLHSVSSSSIIKLIQYYQFSI